MSIKCKPLILGLDVSGMEVLYPLNTRTNDPSIITHFAKLGYKQFRILFRWERLQPSLITDLKSGVASSTVTFDADYLATLLSYVSICDTNNVNCVLQLDNGGWFDVSYDPTYANTGAGDCPSSNYVYIGQDATTINSTSYVGPSVAQFSNMWITLANQSINGMTLSSNSLVKFGLGQKTTLESDRWLPIMNSTIKNLRNASINNRLYVDFTNSSSDYILDFESIADSTSNTICNINYYDDGNSGNGSAVTSTDGYLMEAMSIASIFRGMNASGKVSFGDVRFDNRSTSITALEKFLTYTSSNIDVFESVCLFAIGDSHNIPTSYNLNYTTDSSGNITDVSQITTALNLPSNISTNTSVSEITGTTVSYIQDSPFGDSYQSLETGQLYIPYQILSKSNSFTIELFYKRPTNDASVGYLFGSDSNIGIYFDATNLYFKIGETSYWKVTLADSYNDGNWHHYEIDVDSNGGIIVFIDGSIVAKSNLAIKNTLDPDYTKYFGIRSDSNTTSTAINGNISNLVIWGTNKHDAAFSVPTGYYSGGENYILFNLKLNGDLISYIDQ